MAIKYKKLIYISLFLLAGAGAKAEAATYFVTSGGSGNHSGTAYANAFSVTEHNARTFNPGDTIYIAGKITAAARLVPPSSGTASAYITYRGDYANYPGSLEQTFSYPSVTRLMYIQNKQYLKVINLKFNAHHTLSDSEYAAIWIEENYQSTGYISISGCAFEETVTGVFMRGDVRHVEIKKSIFRNLTNNGVTGLTYYGRSDGLFPNNVTVGGSREDGNTFINVGFLGCKDWKSCTTCSNNICLSGDRSGSVPGEAVGTKYNDLIFSYNHVYADRPGWGGGGAYLNGVNRILLEYNYIHDMDAINRRGPIALKSDFSWKNTDAVIRFNKVGPSHAGNAYTDPGSGIRFNNCLDNIMVYGNLVKDVEGIGIFTTWGWDTDFSSDGCIPEDVFVYSNIVARTASGSGMYMAGTDGTDHFKNFYLTNNLFYHAADDNVTDHPQHSYGIQLLGADKNFQNVYIKNNIIDTPRDLATDHIGLYALTQSDIWYDYNHHYFPNATPAVYFKNSNCIPCAWNSSSRPSGYGAHDSAGDPSYVDPTIFNFSLKENSPCVNTGQALSVSLPSFTIQGKAYVFDLADGLDPAGTDWTSEIPKVAIIKQTGQGAGWEKGPYVYTGTPVSVTGDLNYDGKVDIADYSMFIQDFGKSGTNLPADLNKNGQVEIGDYSIFISNFGKTN